jgi:hypothetical protein
MNPSREAVANQLEKILVSQTLQGSEGLRAFLRFVVEKALEQGQVQLKEYTIAHEVLGRDRNFDPRIDSVVRVQAGRLRSKLHEYYELEGKSDPIVIDLPKGHYTPTFSCADQQETAASEKPVLEGRRSGDKSIFLSPKTRLMTAGFVILCSVLATLAINYRSEASRLKASLDSISSSTNDLDLHRLRPLWNDFQESPEPILVAYSNTIFEGRPETGMKYWKPMYAPQPSRDSPPITRLTGLPDSDRSLIIDHYTGVGEVMGVYSLGDLFWKAGHSFRVKRSLLLTWDDLRTENIVFLGSPAENLLLRDLPQMQDFVFQIVGDRRSAPELAIVNLKPQSGEEKTYLTKRQGPEPDQLYEDYALVSLLKGLDAKHRLLILAGLTTLGTQAAAEYVTKPEHMDELTARLNLSKGASGKGLPPYFQVLLRVKVKGGVPVQISHLTHHVLR